MKIEKHKVVRFHYTLLSAKNMGWGSRASLFYL